MSSHFLVNLSLIIQFLSNIYGVRFVIDNRKNFNLERFLSLGSVSINFSRLMLRLSAVSSIKYILVFIVITLRLIDSAFDPLQLLLNILIARNT